jgi:hypothetical protein
MQPGCRCKAIACTKYSACLLSVPWALQLSRNIPVDAAVIRREGTVLGATTIKWLIDSATMAQFKLNLSYESWSDTFTEEDVDSDFKNLNTYLRIF